jgi:hypothetical protein
MGMVHLRVVGERISFRLTLDSIWVQKVESWVCFPSDALGRAGHGPAEGDSLTLANVAGDFVSHAGTENDPNLASDQAFFIDGIPNNPFRLGDTGLGSFMSGATNQGSFVWKVIGIDGPPPPDWQFRDLPDSPPDNNTAVA